MKEAIEIVQLLTSIAGLIFVLICLWIAGFVVRKLWRER